MEGNLKWHSGTGKWRDHWFVLQTAGPQQQLAYYAARPAPAGGAPQGVIPLAVLNKVVPATGPGDVPAWKEEFQGRCLVLESDDAKHYLVTENRRDMVRWLKELTAIKNAQRRGGINLAASTADSNGTTTTKSTNSESKPWTSSTPEGSNPSDNGRASARGGTARNKRQALVLGKGFKPLAALQDAVQPGSSQEAGAASDKPKDTPEPAEAVAEPAMSNSSSSEPSKEAHSQTSELSATTDKLRQLEERRKRVSMRTTPVKPQSPPAAGQANGSSLQTSNGSGPTATSSADATAQRLREMEMRAEERRKKAEELAAKRKTALHALQGLNSGAAGNTTSPSENHNAGHQEAKQDVSVDKPSEEEVAQPSSILAELKMKKKAENEAKGHVQKMLVGELEARIASKVKQSIAQKRQSMNVEKKLMEAEQLANSKDKQDVTPDVQIQSNDTAQDAKAEDKTATLEQNQEKQDLSKQVAQELNQRTGGDDQVSDLRESEPEDKESKDLGQSKEDASPTSIQDEQQRSVAMQHDGSLLSVALSSKPSGSALVHLTRDRPAPIPDRKRPTSRRRTRPTESPSIPSEPSSPGQDSADASELMPDPASETSASEPETKPPTEGEAVPEPNAEAQAEQPALPDANKEAEIMLVQPEADDSSKPALAIPEVVVEPPPTTPKEEENDQKVKVQTSKQKEALEAPTTKRRSDSDVELAQRVEEIELKKRQMLERMRQRERNKNEQSSQSKLPTILTSEVKPSSEPSKPTEEPANNPQEQEATKRNSWRSPVVPAALSSSPTEDAEKQRQRRASWFAKQESNATDQPAATQQQTSGAGVVEQDKESQKEAMKQMLEMLAKQKAERSEERERLKKMLDERKKRSTEYGNMLDEAEGKQSDEQKSADTLDDERKKQSEEELRKIKEEMRKIRSTIVLIDQESADLNERMAQMRVEELQERRERERRAAEEQSKLEREMREKVMMEKAREILMLRYVPLKTPREVYEHEQHIIEKTTQNAVLINLSGILLGRGRSHGNWFAHQLGRTEIAPAPTPVEEVDEETIVRLKGGIVVRKRDSQSEWELLALPEGAIMTLGNNEGEDTSTNAQSSSSLKAEDEDISLEDEDQAEDEGKDVRKVFINVADTTEVEGLEPEKQALLKDLREAVNKIIAHFSSTESAPHQGALGDESTDRIITRLVRGSLCTILAEILSVGFKSWKFFGSYHLWDYLEAFGQQSDSVTELSALALRNAIKSLNSNVRMTENPNVKFRALICHGLNNKYLDQWLSFLAGRKSLNEKWFNDESLMRHPLASESIAKSLSRLSHLNFTMDINYEVRPVVPANARGRNSPSESPRSGSPASSTREAPADTIEDNEMRMRMRGLSIASAARAAAAATAAAEAFVQPASGDKTNIMAAATDGEGQDRPQSMMTTKGGVKLWGALWSSDSDDGKEGSLNVAESAEDDSARSSGIGWGTLFKSASNLNNSISNSIENYRENKRKEEKRRGKERVRGSDEFEEDIRMERVDDIKIEIKELGADERRSSGGFFSSFIDLAKSIVEDDDAEEKNEEEEEDHSIFDDARTRRSDPSPSSAIFASSSSSRSPSQQDDSLLLKRSGGSWW